MGDQPPMAVGDDASDGMQCSDHPYRNNTGGICAFCLQEKLGKLVSSSNTSSPFFSVHSSSSRSSSSPSFRSDYGNHGSATRTAQPAGRGSGGRSRVPFLSTASKKKISSGGGGEESKGTTSSSSITALPSGSSSNRADNVAVLKRSKSVAPHPGGRADTGTIVTTDSPRKKRFWSLFYLSSAKQQQQQQQQQQQTKESNSSHIDQESSMTESPGGSQASSSSFGRKVARSRSVGCGSRSFSGDFLERISTGFGDCTLRRVESHRESGSNKKMGVAAAAAHHDHGSSHDEQRIKERVKCGGIFGGFGMISSSSSSTYWLSAAAAAAGDEEFGDSCHRIGPRSRGGKSKGWGWAFASPMRAFRPPPAATTTSKSNVILSNSERMMNRGSSNNGGAGANPPSLLAVGS